MCGSGKKSEQNTELTGLSVHWPSEPITSSEHTFLAQVEQVPLAHLRSHSLHAVATAEVFKEFFLKKIDNYFCNEMVVFFELYILNYMLPLYSHKNCYMFY